MKRNSFFLALLLGLMLFLAACSPNVPERATPTPSVTATPAVTSTPEGILDDIGDAGKDMMDDAGNAAKNITRDMENAVH